MITGSPTRRAAILPALGLVIALAMPDRHAAAQAGDATSSAPAASAAGGPRLVNFAGQGVPIIRVTESISKQTGRTVYTRGNASLRSVSLRLRSESFDSAIKKLVESTPGLLSRASDGAAGAVEIWDAESFAKGPNPAATLGADPVTTGERRLVRFAGVGVPIERALESLSKQAGGNAIARGKAVGRKVSLIFKDETFRSALQAIVYSQPDLVFRNPGETSGTIEIWDAESLAKGPNPAATLGADPVITGERRLVRFAGSGVPIERALESISKQAGGNAVARGKAAGRKVSLIFKDETFRAALQKIVYAQPDLVFRNPGETSGTIEIWDAETLAKGPHPAATLGSDPVTTGQRLVRFAGSGVPIEVALASISKQAGGNAVARGKAAGRKVSMVIINETFPAALRKIVYSQPDLVFRQPDGVAGPVEIWDAATYDIQVASTTGAGFRH